MKAVMFDFDGTITKSNGNIWKELWNDLGYFTGKESLYKCLYYEFVKGNISHEEWCDLTCEKFKAKGLTEESFLKRAKNIELMDGAKDTFKRLFDEGYSLHIVSGNFKNVIEQTLGDSVVYFDNISANDAVFDNNGVISAINGTDFDFDGKARYIDLYKEITKSDSEEIIFVGNGDNDEWAHLSGCKTICLNPDDNVEKDNSEKWHTVLENVGDLREILPVVDGLMVEKENEKVEYLAPKLLIETNPSAI